MENEDKITRLITKLKEEYLNEVSPSSNDIVYQAMKKNNHKLAIFRYLLTPDCSNEFKMIIGADAELYLDLKNSSQVENEKMKLDVENTICPHCAATVWQPLEYDFNCDNCNRSILINTKIQITITPEEDMDLYELCNKIDVSIENREKIPQPMSPLPHFEVEENKIILDFIVEVYVKDEKSKCLLTDFNLNCNELKQQWIKFQVVEN